MAAPERGRECVAQPVDRPHTRRHSHLHDGPAHRDVLIGMPSASMPKAGARRHVSDLLTTHVAGSQ
jgi:hypothetical protein